MSELKMKTFDVHNSSPIVSEDSYSGFYRDFKMSYECMVEIRKTENVLKSQALLINSLWESKKKLQEQNKKLKEALERLSKTGDGSHRDKHASFYDCLPTLQIEFSERIDYARAVLKEVRTDS